VQQQPGTGVCTLHADPEIERPADVVGLYMAPPENATVICVDEKPSIQALERAQGYLKLPNGRALTGPAMITSAMAPAPCSLPSTWQPARSPPRKRRVGGASNSSTS
jgi:hypothetical protein